MGGKRRDEAGAKRPLSLSTFTKSFVCKHKHIIYGGKAERGRRKVGGKRGGEKGETMGREKVKTIKQIMTNFFFLSLFAFFEN